MSSEECAANISLQKTARRRPNPCSNFLPAPTKPAAPVAMCGSICSYYKIYSLLSSTMSHERYLFLLHSVDISIDPSKIYLKIYLWKVRSLSSLLAKKCSPLSPRVTSRWLLLPDWGVNSSGSAAGADSRKRPHAEFLPVRRTATLRPMAARALRAAAGPCCIQPP